MTAKLWTIYAALLSFKYSKQLKKIVAAHKVVIVEPTYIVNIYMKLSLKCMHIFMLRFRPCGWGDMS